MFNMPSLVLPVILLDVLSAKYAAYYYIASMIQSVMDSPYIPEFGRNQRGMQAGAEVEDAQAARETWLSARDAAVLHAKTMASLGAHKQVANRIIENYGWTRQVITGTQWANFFAQRTHEDAHPAMRTLSRLMHTAYQRSTPVALVAGEWHLPFVTDSDQGEAADLMPQGFLGTQSDFWRCLVSSARCARVSYNKVSGDDRATFGKLIGGEIIHASPLQHQATPGSMYPSNLRGWVQFRKMWPNECVERFAARVWDVDESCLVTQGDF